MPARAGARQQAFGARRLHRGAAIRPADAMAVAVLPDGFIDRLLPAAQVSGLLLLELATFLSVGSARLPPLQPGGAEGMHEEIEQAREAHPDNRIPQPALAITLNFEVVVEQAGHRQARCPEGIRLVLFIVGIDAVEMDFSQVAVKIGPQDFAAGIEPIAPEAMLHLRFTNAVVVQQQPTGGFSAALVAVDADKLLAQFWGRQQVGIGAGDGLRRKLNRPLTTLELFGDGLQHQLAAGTVVEDPGVVGHAQGVALRVDAPVPLAVLLPEVVLGRRRRRVCGGELAHAGTAADVARHDGDGGLINQQAAFHRGEPAALGLVEQACNPAVKIGEFDGVGHAAEALETFAHRPHVIEIDCDMDRACKSFITA